MDHFGFASARQRYSSFVAGGLASRFGCDHSGLLPRSFRFEGIHSQKVELEECNRAFRLELTGYFRIVGCFAKLMKRKFAGCLLRWLVYSYLCLSCFGFEYCPKVNWCLMGLM